MRIRDNIPLLSIHCTDNNTENKVGNKDECCYKSLTING